MALHNDLGDFPYFVPSPHVPYVWNQNSEMIPVFTESDGPFSLLATGPSVCLGWSRCAEHPWREAGVTPGLEVLQDSVLLACEGADAAPAPPELVVLCCTWATSSLPGREEWASTKPSSATCN